MSCPFLSSELIHKNKQGFLDIQYNLSPLGYFSSKSQNFTGITEGFHAGNDIWKNSRLNILKDKRVSYIERKCIINDFNILFII